MFNSQNRKYLTVALPTVKTADVTKYVPVPGRIKVTKVSLVSDATLAAHADNTCTVTVTNVGDDGTGTAKVAEKVNNVAGGAFTAKVGVAVPVTDANAVIAGGDVLEVKTVEAGVLGADANLTLVIEYVSQ